MPHRTTAELEAGLAEIDRSPTDEGTVELIVRRPTEGEREVLTEGELDCEVGLVGDNWITRPSSRTKDGSAHPDMQLNLMNARAAQLIAGERERWQLAGDQLYLDLDLSDDNLPPGTRLHIGQAVIEITDQPHRGCAKFAHRFGHDALRFVNSKEGVRRNLRGVNAKVIRAGRVKRGETIRKSS